MHQWTSIEQVQNGPYVSRDFNKHIGRVWVRLNTNMTLLYNTYKVFIVILKIFSAFRLKHSSFRSSADVNPMSYDLAHTLL